MSDDELKAARTRVIAVIEHLDGAIKELRRLRNAGILPAGYANAEIDVLRDKRSDYEDMEAAMGATTPVSSLPSDADVEKLATAVSTLRVHNVAEKSARDAISDIATIVKAAGAFDSPAFLAALKPDDLILDALPDAVMASMQVRNASLARLSSSGALGLEFLVTDLRSWRPRDVVTVAFLDGDPDLHRDIAMAAEPISKACALLLDFGELADGTFRRWTEQDSGYAADIRVSFNKQGYFSLVGIDSIDAGIGAPMDDVGGSPHQASLNLGGFAIAKPEGWRGTVLHEFLHALGFHHSHQNMRGPCESSFRWDDDEGYSPTKDNRGTYVADGNGKRPGIYTYLAGFPNFWSKAKVDHNLRTEEDQNVIAGPFDPASVMLYRFPTHFYKSLPSPCAPTTNGQQLSDGDIRGLQLLYPGDPAIRAEAVAAHEQALAAVGTGMTEAAAGLEDADKTPSLSSMASLAEAIRLKLKG